MTQVHEEVKELIRNLEGFRAQAYRDASGFSIGFGHHIQPHEKHLLDTTLTREQAEEFLERDILKHQEGIHKWLERPISGNKMAALTALAYNVGAHSSALKRIVTLYNEGKEEEAAQVFHEYNKSRKTKDGPAEVNPELVKRRAFEAELFQTTGPVNMREAHSRHYGKRSNTAQIQSKPVIERTISKGILPDNLQMSENDRVLAGLVQLNASLGVRSGSFANEENYLVRLRQEGSGL